MGKSIRLQLQDRIQKDHVYGEDQQEIIGVQIVGNQKRDNTGQKGSRKAKQSNEKKPKQKIVDTDDEQKTKEQKKKTYKKINKICGSEEAMNGEEYKAIIIGQDIERSCVW
eukprot:TRINITY_DN10558_c0_g2_i1.p2 TRINITY_DN10558_c0_g2~~TRINITY_DN10558_c0_g2_i1.p2  ORF type:complete len:111 (-),score=18.35 TRINITY_DN10558_c0_g2_i1:244-576(-)